MICLLCIDIGHCKADALIGTAAYYRELFTV